MIVVDASVLEPAFVSSAADGAMARSALAGDALAVPAHADVEVMSVMRRHMLRGLLSDTGFEGAYRRYVNSQLIRYPLTPLMRRALELRHNLTPYDAAYVALAELLECPLVTADRRMAAAPGLRCEVRVLA